MQHMEGADRLKVMACESYLGAQEVRSAAGRPLCCEAWRARKGSSL
jgi:hypothetical protein